MRQTKIKRDLRCFSTQNDLMKTINQNGVHTVESGTLFLQYIAHDFLVAFE